MYVCMQMKCWQIDVLYFLVFLNVFVIVALQDFKRMCVVSRPTKLMAAVVLFLMNFFFAYYSVLYGYLHGIGWQRNYLVACVVKLIVEVFINETIEVLWVNVLAPSLVQSEVHTVIREVVHLVNKMFIRSPPEPLHSTYGSPTSTTHADANVPEYLYVSTKVAKAFPALLESKIVGMFTTHLPGELSRKWRDPTATAATTGPPVSLDRSGFFGEYLRFSSLFAVAFSVLRARRRWRYRER